MKAFSRCVRRVLSQREWSVAMAGSWTRSSFWWASFVQVRSSFWRASSSLSIQSEEDDADARGHQLYLETTSSKQSVLEFSFAQFALANGKKTIARSTFIIKKNNFLAALANRKKNLKLTALASWIFISLPVLNCDRDKTFSESRAR